MADVRSDGRVLSATGLTKRYGDRVALDGVSIGADRGELVAVIGPNGAGKTTLLSILAGIVAADAGTLERAPATAGWVPQQTALYRRLTVAENLRLFARLERVADVEGAVARMLEASGLAARRDDQVAALSGGNRQRVNVAIGLLQDPQALLLDEPSAALDPRQRERLWEMVVGLAATGTAVIFSTHHVQEAERHADRVVVLADGRALFDGPPADLRAAAGAGAVDFEAAFVAYLAGR